MHLKKLSVSVTYFKPCRFLESGMEAAHKLREGDNHYMIHEHKPGHQLKVKDNWTNYNCSGCKIEGFGLHYECVNASCSFLLHEECMSPRKVTKHEFFPELTFAFNCLHGTSYGKDTKKAHIFCDACGLGVNGYSYRSLDGMNNLHPCCINFPRETICGNTGAKLVLQKKTMFTCSYCNARNLKVGNKSTNHVWSYVSESDDIHWHIGCLIEMLTELKRDSIGSLVSCKMSRKNGVGNMNLQLALRDAKVKWGRKISNFVQYTKIALGAIIAALVGDTTTLFVNSAMALAYK